MSISIVIPNYNGLHMIKECLSSIFKLTLDPDEIIVVDNGSSDQSCDWIREHYPSVILIENKENLGFSIAVNQGIRISDSEFIVLLNNDVVVDESWLYELVSLIRTDPLIFSCSSKMLRYYERDKIDDVGDGYTLLGWAYKRGDGVSSNKYLKDEKVFSSCGGAAIYRKSILDKIGYFDERFFAYLEDVDIGFRSLNAGFKNMYCANAIVYHVGSATTGSKYNDFKVKLSAKNNLLVIFNNFHVFHIIINFPFLLLGYIMKMFYFYKKDYLKAYVSGTKEAFYQLKTNKNYHRVGYYSVCNVLRVEYYLIKNMICYCIQKLKIGF
jgi:GT2 family glycosyltransferase